MYVARTACLLLLAFAASLAAQTNDVVTTPNPIVAYVYIGEAANRIGAFAVRKNGAATVVSGSPFPGPSRGVVASSGFVFGSDGTNIVTYARAAATGKLHVSSVIDGVTHAPGGVITSLTLDRTGRSLYAAEPQGAGDVSYGEFGVTNTGVLQYHANTPVSVALGSPLQFSQNNQFAFGDDCEHDDWNVSALHREASGLLFFTLQGAAPPRHRETRASARGHWRLRREDSWRPDTTLVLPQLRIALPFTGSQPPEGEYLPLPPRPSLPASSGWGLIRLEISWRSQERTALGRIG